VKRFFEKYRGRARRPSGGFAGARAAGRAALHIRKKRRLRPVPDGVWTDGAVD